MWMQVAGRVGVRMRDSEGYQYYSCSECVEMVRQGSRRGNNQHVAAGVCHLSTILTHLQNTAKDSA